VLIPTFNDWEALGELLPALERELVSNELAVRVLVVDDGSTERGECAGQSNWTAVRSLEVLRLRRNMGHQRAIAVGLCHLVEHQAGRGIVVMDGDGQDKPTDVPRLLSASRASPDDHAVFGSRLRRSEGVVFALFYHLYRLLHWMLTGVPVRIGNFSYLPWRDASGLVVCWELWNHYAAAVIHARIPFRTVPCARGHRLKGQSKMHPVSLVIHGLSAMAVFSDRIGVRVLAVSGVLSTLAVLGSGAMLSLKYGTSLTVPGWETWASGLLLVVVGELMLVSTLFTFIILSGRSTSLVIPLRDYSIFIDPAAHR
jgi:polyisoprenyl-phosphate glycosyltransferase